MKVYICLIVFLAVVESNAQQQKFDYFAYTMPAGYTEKSSQDYRDYIKYNASKTAYAQLTFYRSRAGTPDVNAEYLKEWNQLIKRTTQVEAPDVQPSEEENGWKTVFGTTPIKWEKGQYIQTLIVFAGNGLATSLSIRVTDNTFSQEIESILQSISIAKPDEKPAPVVAVANTQASSGTQASSPLIGVWRGFGPSSSIFGVTNAAGTGFASVTYSSRDALKQIVFLADGSFCTFLPSEGLLSVADNKNKNPYSWGKYEMPDNAMGTVYLGKTLQMPMVLSGTDLQFDQTKFHKVEQAEHLKLNGTYSAEKSRDAYGAQMPAEPIIIFHSDGTFEDQGAIYWVRHVRGYNEDQQDKTFGKGKYDVVSYTIIFSYDDGRKINASLIYFDVNQLSMAGITLDRR